MDLSNFFRICVYFCLVMITFNLAVTFVSALNLFEPVDSGMDVNLSDKDTTASSIFEAFSRFTGGMGQIWIVLTTVTGLTSLVIARLVGNSSIIGVWLFGEVFWTSYTSALNVTHLSSYIPFEFLILFTVALMFIWVGAIISMLTAVS